MSIDIFPRRHGNGQKSHEDRHVFLNYWGNKVENLTKCHLPSRILLCPKAGNDLGWWGFEEIGTLMHCWCDCKNGEAA